MVKLFAQPSAPADDQLGVKIQIMVDDNGTLDRCLVDHQGEIIQSGCQLQKITFPFAASLLGFFQQDHGMLADFKTSFGMNRFVLISPDCQHQGVVVCQQTQQQLQAEFRPCVQQQRKKEKLTNPL